MLTDCSDSVITLTLGWEVFSVNRIFIPAMSVETIEMAKETLLA